MTACESGTWPPGWATRFAATGRRSATCRRSRRRTSPPPDRRRLVGRLGADARRLAGRELDADQGTGDDGDVVEAAIAGHLHVHRTLDTGGKARHDPRRRIEAPDPPPAEVGEEVIADVIGRELDVRGRIERRAGDRAASVPVAVGVQRATEPRIARGSLRLRPPVVRSGDAVVDLLPGVLAHIIDEHAAGAGMEREVERVAEPESPDRRVGAGCAEERVVSRDRPVRVDPEHLAEPGGQRLGVTRFALSPTATYSFRSAPKWIAPPLWRFALISGSRSRMMVSLPGMATSPLAVSRLTRLWSVGVLAV